MLVQAVEKFAQRIPLNLEEIFIWYFEQKGVDNPERFLGEVNQPPELALPDVRQEPAEEVENPQELIMQQMIQQLMQKPDILSQILQQKGNNNIGLLEVLKKLKENRG